MNISFFDLEIIYYYYFFFKFEKIKDYLQVKYIECLLMKRNFFI